MSLRGEGNGAAKAREGGKAAAASGALRILAALDFPRPAEALGWAERLRGEVFGFKVGLELFTAGGPETVRELVSGGSFVFLDLKYFDIPRTVERAVRQAVRLGVGMLDVHALGGEEMLRRAREAVLEESMICQCSPPLLVAVTVLTSWDEGALGEALGSSRRVEDEVLRLAEKARRCGLDGVVCGAREAVRVKEVCGRRFLTVVPGVRLPGEPLDDQRRGTVVARGGLDVDYYVVGRSLFREGDPLARLGRWMEILRGAGDERGGDQKPHQESGCP